MMLKNKKIAQIQHITYNEYLPVVLGSETMKRFSLVPGKGFEKLNTYDPLVDPRIANEVRHFSKANFDTI